MMDHQNPISCSDEKEMRRHLNISMLTLNKRWSRSGNDGIMVIPKSKTPPKSAGRNSEGNVESTAIPSLDNLSEMQRENVQRLLLSHLALEHVSKPKKFLFGHGTLRKMEDDQSCGVPDQSKTSGFPAVAEKVRYTTKLSSKILKTQDAVNKSLPNRKYLALSDITNKPKCVRKLDIELLKAPVELQPNYYQKWARNKNSGGKLNLATVSIPVKTYQFSRSKVNSGLKRKTSIKLRRKKKKPSKKFTQSNAAEPSGEHDVRLNGLGTPENEQTEKFELDYSDFLEDLETESEDTDLESDDMENVAEYTNKRFPVYNDNTMMESGILENNEIFGTDQQCSSSVHSYNDLTAESLGGEEPLLPLSPLTDNPNASLNIGISSKTSADSRRDSVHREPMSLTSREISASVLLSVASGTQRYALKPRQSAGIASRRIHGLRSSKVDRKPENRLFVALTAPSHMDLLNNEKTSKKASSISDSVQSFRCRKTGFPEIQTCHVKPSSTIHRNKSRVAVKMSDTSPRYTGPENLVVDFQALRIAAHLQRLQTSVQNVTRDSCMKSLSNCKHSGRMPFIDKDGFTTVISGCAVK